LRVEFEASESEDSFQPESEEFNTVIFVIKLVVVSRLLPFLKLSLQAAIDLYDVIELKRQDVKFNNIDFLRSDH